MKDLYLKKKKSALKGIIYYIALCSLYKDLLGMHIIFAFRLQYSGMKSPYCGLLSNASK